jgi:hypothetical protein
MHAPGRIRRASLTEARAPLIMPAHKLLLHPEDAGFRVTAGRMATALLELGLIGAPRPLGNGVYYPAGHAFLELVTFLGCSPAIELEPPQDPALLADASANGTFCHVFLDSDDRPRFRHDPRSPAPACPSCRRPLDGWPALCAQAREDPASAVWTCTACGRHGAFAGLLLRKGAAFASCWVEIRGIYPSEAVPGPELMQTLQQLGGGAWRPTYLRE